jgi:hypothetical protein
MRGFPVENWQYFILRPISLIHVHTCKISLIFRQGCEGQEGMSSVRNLREFYAYARESRPVEKW